MRRTQTNSANQHGQAVAANQANNPSNQVSRQASLNIKTNPNIQIQAGSNNQYGINDQNYQNNFGLQGGTEGRQAQSFQQQIGMNNKTSGVDFQGNRSGQFAVNTQSPISLRQTDASGTNLQSGITQNNSGRLNFQTGLNMTNQGRGIRDQNLGIVNENTVSGITVNGQGKLDNVSYQGSQYSHDSQGFEYGSSQSSRNQISNSSVQNQIGQTQLGQAQLGQNYAVQSPNQTRQSNVLGQGSHGKGGRCMFDDGAQYLGEWEDGMAHGFGICNGSPNLLPQQYAGKWQYGNESSGCFTWDGDLNSYSGQWHQGKFHGTGVERRGHWVYKGEWNQGLKGRYGVRQSTLTGMKFEGTWNVGLLDGYGTETYPDGSTFFGQYMRGVRHGYGVRQSVPYAVAIRSNADVFNLITNEMTSSGHVTSPASSNTLGQIRARDQRMEECKGGFVLMSRLDDPKKRRMILDKQGRPSIRKTIVNEIRLIRQRSVGESVGEDNRSSNYNRPSSVSGSVRSTTSQLSQLSQKTSPSMYSQEDEGSFVSSREDDVINDDVTERYLGEWKNDKRTGYGVCERSDGLTYEGEWLNNRRHGYGVTTMQDGHKFEGKYKNNVFIDSNASTTAKIFTLRPGKIKDRVDAAVVAAHRAASMALDKQATSNERMMSARQKALEAEEMSKKGLLDAEMARKSLFDISPNNFTDVAVIANRPGHDSGFASRLIDPSLSPNKKFNFFKSKKIEPPVTYPITTTYVTVNPIPSAAVNSNFDQIESRSGALLKVPQQEYTVTTNINASILKANRENNMSNAQQPSSYLVKDEALSSRPAVSFSSVGSVNSPVSNPSIQYSVSEPDKFHANFTYVEPNKAMITKNLPPQKFAHNLPASQNVSLAQMSLNLPGTILTEGGGSKYQTGLYKLEDGSQPQTFSLTNNFHASTMYKPPHPSDNPISLSHVESFSTDHYSPSANLEGKYGRCYGDAYGIETAIEALSDRRKSLPAIVKQKIPDSIEKGLAYIHEEETYIIEDGVRRRRVRQIEEVSGATDSSSPRTTGPGTNNIVKAAAALSSSSFYKVEPPKQPYKQGDRGSVPNVGIVGKEEVLPREIVYALSQRRREEMMVERAEREKRQMANIVLRFGDLLGWFGDHQLFLLIIFFNIALFVAFYNLLRR